MANHTSGNVKGTDLAGSSQQPPKHSAVAYRIRHRIISIIACIVIAALAFAGTAAASVWLDINSIIQDNSVKTIGSDDDIEYIDSSAGRPISFVLIGQDTRDDGNGALSGGVGDDVGLHNADTTMVVQISADRSFIDFVSIPRDTIVDVPSCQTTKGVIPAQYGVMFNSIFSTAYREGGDLSSAASCTVEAVNSISGLHITNFIVVDFKGLAEMIDALGGVDVCIPVHTVDPNTDMDYPKGMRHLNGQEATNYARMRHGTGTDGSDIMRTTRQQYLIKAVLDEAISKNLFTQSAQLYQLVTSALRSLKISEGMANTNALVGLAMSLRNLQMSHVYSQTMPVVPAPFDPNRVVFADSAAEVWEKFKEDKPLFSTDDTGDSTDDSSDSSSASAEPSPTTSEEPSTEPTDDASSSASASSTPQPTVDPETGLIKQADGTLIDPETGGTVDAETGAIVDPETHQYVGIAYEYLNTTVCKVE